MRNHRLPEEFRRPIPSGKKFFSLLQTLEKNDLNTVCEEAKCPNRTDCYNRGTLTFQILGSLCTRRCGFCAETTAKPHAVDPTEPQRILQAVRELNLKHVVITAPARDDLNDGGASVFYQTVRLIKSQIPNVTVEILTSDFEGRAQSLKTALDSFPHVFNHNVETTERLTPAVRAKATYRRSLEILRFASAYSSNFNPSYKIKSGIMLGLGESLDEIFKTFLDLRNSGVQYLTIGQYLQPSDKHLPVQKYYAAYEFQELEKIAYTQNFEKVFAGPLVRSSYHADEMINSI